MASLPTYTMELPPLDHSDSPPTSSRSTGDQSSPIIPYLSTSMPPTAPATAAPIYGWPLSPSTSLYFPGYSPPPYSLGLISNPNEPTLNPYAYNYCPTAVPTRMPSSSSVPIANCPNLMDVFGAAPMRSDCERFNPNAMGTSADFVSPCSTPDSPKDKASGSNLDLRRLRAPTPEPRADPASTQSATVELSPVEGSIPEAAPRKRSRAVQACDRCRIRKARCFGGSPCNRCIKRTFDCEFTPTRQRGSNKSRSPEKLNFHAHPQSSMDHHHMRPHTHAQAHHGSAQRPVALAPTHTHGHGHTSRPRVRRRSTPMQAPNPASASSMMPAMPSVFRPMPMNTTTMPHPETPAVGLGLQLNPAIDEDVDGQSDPDFGNPSSAPLLASNFNLRSSSDFGMGPTITIPCPNVSTTFNPYVSNMNGKLDLYDPLVYDETMVMFSPQGVSGTSYDSGGSYDFSFTPVTQTLPLPMPDLGLQPSRRVSSPLEDTVMTSSSRSGLGDMMSPSGNLPSSGVKPRFLAVQDAV